MCRKSDVFDGISQIRSIPQCIQGSSGGGIGCSSRWGWGGSGAFIWHSWHVLTWKIENQTRKYIHVIKSNTYIIFHISIQSNPIVFRSDCLDSCPRSSLGSIMIVPNDIGNFRTSRDLEECFIAIPIETLQVLIDK